MYCINGKVSKNQFTFQLCIYINYFSKASFYFKMVVVNVICFIELTNGRWFIRRVYWWYGCLIKKMIMDISII